MTRSLKIFTLFGTPVRIAYTWPIAPIFITIALGASYTGLDSTALSYGFGALIALWLVASILLHEFAHVLVARRLGIGTSGITLFVLGGVSHIDEDETGPGKDLAVSIAGPLVSIALGLALGVVSFLTDAFLAPVYCNELYEEYYSTVTDERIRVTLACSWGPIFPVLLFNYLALVNIVIGLFNLLPLFPLDGGRILSALLWKITSNRQRAIRIAALIGQFGAGVMILYGVLNLFSGEPNGELIVGVWFIAIGVFLMEAAVGASPRTKEGQSAPD